jgi:hypothetical protein
MGVDYTFQVYASNVEGGGTRSSASNTVHTPDPLPSITSATIDGTLIFGQTLSSTANGVSGNPTGTTYQWKRDSQNINGATSSAYQLGSGDTGSKISVTITVTNAQGSASATSAETIAIGKATPTVSIALSAATPTYGVVDTITATASLPGTGCIQDFRHRDHWL